MAAGRAEPAAAPAGPVARPARVLRIMAWSAAGVVLLGGGGLG